MTGNSCSNPLVQVFVKLNLIERAYCFLIVTFFLKFK